jgi:hypothetical protein
VLPVLLGLTLLAMAACTHAGLRSDAGDPGDRRLDQISKDRVFASLPAGAVAAGPLDKMPARYRAPAFQGAGWDGPAVSLRFTSSRSPASVFAFFEASAAAAGWSPGNRNTLGYPQTWIKTYRDGVRGELSLIRTVRAPAGGPSTYVLTASSPPAASS